MDAKSADAFVEFAKNNPLLAENKIIAFLSSERARADCNEISAGTINNSVKATRLFLEMNYMQLNWKKIHRVLPRATRLYSRKHLPTLVASVVVVNRQGILVDGTAISLLRCGQLQTKVCLSFFFILYL
jgi:hypothetical protein